jgi:hypothetical protein
VNTVIITGTATNVCCESTARAAYMRDYLVDFPTTRMRHLMRRCTRRRSRHRLVLRPGDVHRGTVTKYVLPNSIREKDGFMAVWRKSRSVEGLCPWIE